MVSEMDSYAQLANLANSQVQQASPYPPQQPDDQIGKRKAEDGSQQQPQQRAKRNRYISIACNECKRRKIKCNGQTPCQRCGNLNLECVYAPNCCNGFKDSHEYKEMEAHIASLQDQVNMLYADLSSLRAQLGQQPPPQMPQHQQSVPPPPAPPQISQHSAAIDPSLQSSPFPSHRQSFSMPHASPAAPVASMSPSSARPHSQSQDQQPPFRGPTSTEFAFGVAKSSLQTMGITGQDGGGDGSGSGGTNTGDISPVGSPPIRNGQVLQTFHADKDPVWSVSQSEALRLCRVFEDEMGIMHPVLDVNRIIAYAKNLYRFMEAAHRTGLMQAGLPGSDAIEDENANILKMVLALGLTVEGGGRSDLGLRLFESVQPAVDNMLLGRVGVNGIRLLTMTALYEFNRDNEGTSWRITGLTARLCIELGLHRCETYDAIQDESERAETLLLFWSIYVLDRRWSFGTGMPFALQDADIDPNLPKPEDRSPYLTVMIQFSAIGTKVWRTVGATASSFGSNHINTEEINYLDYQVIQWHRQIPAQFRFDPASQTGGPTLSRAGRRLRILLYLRANNMRIHIYRPVLHSATSIMQYRHQAETVVNIAKDTIRILAHTNQTSDLYRTHQVLFNAFLTSALAVLFLAVSHTPATFAESVREEFYMALDLVRGFSRNSWVGKRLWKTIRVLKELGPKLGLRTNERTVKATPPQRSAEGEMDPSRSAAVAMAGLAGHNVDETALFNGRMSQWSGSSGSSTSPDRMANDLTTLFEAAGGPKAIASNGLAGGAGPGEMYTPDSGADHGAQQNAFGGNEELSNILKELF